MTRYKGLAVPGQSHRGLIGPGVTAFGPSLLPYSQSAWNRNSRKSTFTILYSSGPSDRAGRPSFSSMH